MAKDVYTFARAGARTCGAGVKVLNVAYPFARVHSATAGGAEQVLSMLDRGLEREGHESYVVACEGSEVRGQLMATPLPKGTFDGAARDATWRAYKSAIDCALKRWQPDVAHFHGLDFPRYLPERGVPAIATLHLPPSWYEARVFAMERARTWIHCVSQSQEDACPAAENLLPHIANGVSEDLPARGVRRRGFALSLGRICPEKGFHFAFEAVARARVPYLLAGEIHPYAEHRRYFAEQIGPRCGKDARFIGPVGDRKKQRLLTAARCVLIPSLAPETSSLVAMEAAMCGTPVIAFRAGALPEVVRDGVTGFLVDDTAQMARAIEECGRIDPAVCRAVALERFSERAMVSAYLRMYERVIAC